MEGTIDADTQNMIGQMAQLQLEKAELEKKVENLKNTWSKERERRMYEGEVFNEIIEKLIDKLDRR